MKWLNAWSEKDGLTPVYTVGGAVMRTGEAAPDINYTADGYRLPTEAEWEKAARGGLSGKRFPWGNEINHEFENYMANSSLYSYDTSPYTVSTYHPSYNDGIGPYISPVGVFTENGFGLFDMTGNLSEWCSDWYSSTYYSSSPLTYPIGPPAGSRRVIRGGYWSNNAQYCRSAYRDYGTPDSRYNSLGFRPVRSE